MISMARWSRSARYCATVSVEHDAAVRDNAKHHAEAANDGERQRRVV
jgi:hypothetical protein